MPANQELETIEIALLLDGIYRHYGYDCREYAPAFLQRRIKEILLNEGLKTVSHLQSKILHDSGYLGHFIDHLSIGTSSMFRDPGFYLAFRNEVVPLLATYPFTRLWLAGCGMGEEIYSIAILLKEEKLYERCRIYATDQNESFLQKAREGIFSLAQMKEYTQNYIQAGGRRDFSEYYTSGYDNAIFRPFLKENVVFAQHNLASDGSFNEFHVILCRNVLIYFALPLQCRVHRLFYDSLVILGVLGLGKSEDIKFSPHEKEYEELVGKDRLYRKTGKLHD
jgi:chemotaxis protein methyltransferase CheR